MLAGCGGSQPPIGAPGTTPQSSAIAAHPDRGRSWMLPEAKSKDLLYVGDIYDVTVYSYPQGKLEGRLKGFYEIGGECVDKGGHVFVVNAGGNDVIEYAHGGNAPIATLKAATSNPTGCDVDPITGDLAVSGGTVFSGGNVAVYPHEKEPPTVYTDSNFRQFGWCGYDDSGDLYVNGASYSNTVVFAELQKGAGVLTNTTLDQSFQDTGGIQWDGKYLAVGDQSLPKIYRFSMSGSKGTKVGTIDLGSHADFVHQFFIFDGKLIAPNFYWIGNQFESNVLFFDYPAGGRAYKKITRGVKASEAAVISLAQK
jgi:hypothetical protein